LITVDVSASTGAFVGTVCLMAVCCSLVLSFEANRMS